MGNNISHIGIGVLYFLKNLTKSCFVSDKKLSDIVLYGRILINWEKLVGIDVARNIYPTRVIKNRLKVICRDSQWLQILVYLKSQILEKINNMIKGGRRVNEIFGVVGEIPKVERREELNFPNWNEQDQDVARILESENNELLKKIIICKKKLNARLLGFINYGYELCSKCKSNLVFVGKKDNKLADTVNQENEKNRFANNSEDIFCSICINSIRNKQKMILRKIIYDLPWISYSFVSKSFTHIRKEDFDEVKSFIIEILKNKVSDLLDKIIESCNYNLLKKVSMDIQKLIILESCDDVSHLYPDLACILERVNLDDKVRGKIYVDTHWR